MLPNDLGGRVSDDVWPCPAVLTWEAVVGDRVCSDDQARWGRQAVFDSVEDYKVMGLIHFQGAQLRQGLRSLMHELARIYNEFELPLSADPLPGLERLETDVPGVLDEEERSGDQLEWSMDGHALLSGLTWAVQRSEEVSKSELTFAYDWSPTRRQFECTMAHMSGTEEIGWQFADHACDRDTSVGHLESDLRLMHVLMQRLACLSGELPARLVSSLADNPLMPGDEPDISIADDLDAADVIVAIWDQMADFHEAAAITFQAVDGHRTCQWPPWPHVLDAAVRYYDLVDDDDAAARPSASTVAVVVELPNCDFCSAAARVDGWQTGPDDPARVACNFCPDCFAKRSTGKLGARYGGQLILYSELTPLIQDVCNELARREDRDLIFPERERDHTSGTVVPARQSATELDDLRRRFAEAQELLAATRELASAERRAARQEAESIAAGFVKMSDGRLQMTTQQHKDYVSAARRANTMQAHLDRIEQLIKPIEC